MKDKEKLLFKNFGEYWYYTRALSEGQRRIVFRSLSTAQKSVLDNSYCKEGWNDVFCRNEISEKIDQLHREYGYNLIDIRARAMRGKSVYVPSSFWREVKKQMGHYRPEILQFAIQGLKGEECEINPEVCLITFEK